MIEQDLIRDIFYSEVEELFENIDSSLLDLEKDPSNKELLNSVFRDFHTLKGSSGMFGFDILEKSTHVLEDLLDNLRSGHITLNVSMMDALFDSLDILKKIFELKKHDQFIPPDVFEATSLRLMAFLPADFLEQDLFEEIPLSDYIADSGVNKKFIKALAATNIEKIKSLASIGRSVYIINLKFKKGVIMAGTDPLNLLKALNRDGELVEVTTDVKSVPMVDVMEASDYYLGKIQALYVSTKEMPFVHGIFEFCAEDGGVDIHEFTVDELSEFFDVKKIQKVTSYDVDTFWSEAGGGDEWVEADYDVTLPSAEELISEIKESIGRVSSAAKNLKGKKKKDISKPDIADEFGYIFRFFHNLHTTAAMVGIDDVAKEAADYETLLSGVTEGKKKLTNKMLDSVLKGLVSMEAILFNLAHEVHDDDNGIGEEEKSFKGKKLGEILVEINAVTSQDIDDAVDLQQSSLGEILVKKGKTTQTKVDEALEIQKKSGQVFKTSIKIDSERLDNIVDMVGELVITQTLVNHDSIEIVHDNTKLGKNLAQLTKITKILQDHVMGLRMLPLRQTFQRMARVVRDASKKSNKEVVFNYFGENTEVDKTVIDKIGDPLIHILRNSVDHGIESPNVRMSLGKSAVGLIEVKAFHQGGNVVIEVSDDGGGLSRDSILMKAVEKGIVKGSIDDMSDKEVFNLIFEPGFSTAKEITEISGRGVGLDVVRKNVEMLRGRVDLTSEVGVGTTFSIKLPLTLAIIDGMVLRVGKENYIVPTLSVERSLRPSKDDISSIGGKGELVKVRDELYPVIRLSHVFNHTDNVIEDPTEATLLLVESEGKKFCLMVDEIVEHQQVVIKSLGEKFKGLQGVSGCSILGDGRVALIVDISGLLTFLEIS